MAEKGKYIPPALRQGAAAVQAGNQDRRREGLRRINQREMHRRRKDNAARALHEARGVQTTIEGDILKVDNGPEIFQPFPMFNECDDIHFHIYPIFGAGIRFRFKDGSELKYDIPSNERRDPSFGLKYRGDIPNYTNIRVRQGRYRDHEDEIYRTIAHQTYVDTAVWKAIRECAELPNPYNPIRGNGFSSFMEEIEGLTGIVSQRVHAGGKKGSRKTRKYKKRGVRKSRKKIKSRKSRKIKRASKSRKKRKVRKSRRRRSSRRRR